MLKGYCTACFVEGAYEVVEGYYACTPECEDLVGELLEAEQLESEVQGI